MAWLLCDPGLWVVSWHLWGGKPVAEGPPLQAGLLSQCLSFPLGAGQGPRVEGDPAPPQKALSASGGPQAGFPCTESPGLAVAGQALLVPAPLMAS